jgi:hypothetical protein
MRLFIIGGKSGTGKNELANMIKTYYQNMGEKSLITEYSKYIKLMAKEMVNWDGKRETKPRKFLQDMGTLMRQRNGEDVFIKRMQEDIKIYNIYYDNIIISDARLDNELSLMKDKYDNCYTIHLVSNHKNDLNTSEKNHITETELDNYPDFDYVIDSSDLDELNKKIINILEVIK